MVQVQQNSCIKPFVQLNNHFAGKTISSAETFGDLRMSDITKHCVITTYNITRQEGCLFTEQSKDVYIRDVANASSAAPIYFPPVEINGKYVPKYCRDITNKLLICLSWYIDGGICCNDPALCAYIHALERFGPHVDIRVLSVSTGEMCKSVEGRKAQKVLSRIVGRLIPMF